MGITEIILLILGVCAFVLSFVLPEKKDRLSDEDRRLGEEQIKEMLEEQMRDIKTRVAEILDDEVAHGLEKTERSVERVSNEKVMMINEYSDTVLEAIHKNHEEVVFLYDMLNDKQETLKNAALALQKQAKVVMEQTQAVELQVKTVKEQSEAVGRQVVEVREQSEAVEEKVKEVRERTEAVEEKVREVKEQTLAVERQAQEVREQREVVEQQTREVREQREAVEKQTQELWEQKEAVEKQTQELWEQKEAVEQQAQSLAAAAASVIQSTPRRERENGADVSVSRRERENGADVSAPRRGQESTDISAARQEQENEPDGFVRGWGSGTDVSAPSRSGENEPDLTDPFAAQPEKLGLDAGKAETPARGGAELSQTGAESGRNVSAARDGNEAGAGSGEPQAGDESGAGVGAGPAQQESGDGFSALRPDRIEPGQASVIERAEESGKKPDRKRRRPAAEAEPEKDREPQRDREPERPAVNLSFADTGGNGRNNNEKILAMHKEGKSNVAIARELGLGIGEVKLVIDLFKGSQK